MAIQNRRAIANRLNRDKGNAPAHPSERERAAAKPAAKPAKRQARKRGR